MTTYDPGGDTTDQLVDHDGYLLPGPRETVDWWEKLSLDRTYQLVGRYPNLAHHLVELSQAVDALETIDQ